MARPHLISLKAVRSLGSCHNGCLWVWRRVEGRGREFYNIIFIFFSTAAGRILFAGYDDSSVRAWDVIKVHKLTNSISVSFPDHVWEWDWQLYVSTPHLRAYFQRYFQKQICTCPYMCTPYPSLASQTLFCFTTQIDFSISMQSQYWKWLVLWNRKGLAHKTNSTLVSGDAELYKTGWKIVVPRKEIKAWGQS